MCRSLGCPCKTNSPFVTSKPLHLHYHQRLMWLFYLLFLIAFIDRFILLLLLELSFLEICLVENLHGYAFSCVLFLSLYPAPDHIANFGFCVNDICKVPSSLEIYFLVLACRPLNSSFRHHCQSRFQDHQLCFVLVESDF